MGALVISNIDVGILINLFDRLGKYNLFDGRHSVHIRINHKNTTVVIGGIDVDGTVLIEILIDVYFDKDGVDSSQHVGRILSRQEPVQRNDSLEEQFVVPDFVLEQVLALLAEHVQAGVVEVFNINHSDKLLQLAALETGYIVVVPSPEVRKHC